MITDHSDSAASSEAIALTPSSTGHSVGKASLFAKVALVLVTIAFLSLAWQWLNTRHRFNAIEKSLSAKLEAYQALNQQSFALAKAAEERSAQANARTIILEQRLAQSRDQQEVLQALYDQLAENREATAVAEVEQVLTIANQQLQLAGNIKSALLALQAADTRLSSLSLPRAIQMRETLAQDIATLRKFPQVDIVSINQQLNIIMRLCDQMPLISEREAQVNRTQAPTNPPQDRYHILKFANDLWADIKNVVTIERIDQPKAPLLSQEHAFYLRENLKLRLLTARIALLQRDEASYVADMHAVTLWINQYFDTQHKKTIRVLSLLKAISAENIGVKIPDINESLSALNRYQLSLEQD